MLDKLIEVEWPMEYVGGGNPYFKFLRENEYAELEDKSKIDWGIIQIELVEVLKSATGQDIVVWRKRFVVPDEAIYGTWRYNINRMQTVKRHIYRNVRGNPPVFKDKPLAINKPE